MRISLLALGLLASSAITAPALAATTTWTGTSVGVPNEDTGGNDFYTVSFTFDDTPSPYPVFHLVTTNPQPGIAYDYSYYLNIRSFSVTGPGLSVTVGSGQSQVSTLASTYRDSGLPGLLVNGGSDGTTIGYGLQFIYHPGPGFATTAMPTSLDVASAFESSFNLVDNYYDGDPADEIITQQTILNFRFASGGIVPAASAVPEPASWAMMLLGFGAVGAGLRRRGKATTTVSYV